MATPTTSDQISAPTPMSQPTPLVPVRLGPTQRVRSLIDNVSMRPGYGLTPDKLWSAYRQAELGAPLMQCDVFEDILENDGHLRGQYESRLASVAFRPWILQPGNKDGKSIAAAAALSNALSRVNMLSLLWHLMQALGFGYSGANTVWGVDTTEATPVIAPIWFLLAPHRRFLVSIPGALTFRVDGNDWPGEPLNYGEWIVAQRPHRQVVRAGAFRTTSWWALFKRMSVTDWIIVAEKFGIPYVVGEYEERASDVSRAALQQAITDIGTDGQAMLAESTKIIVSSEAMRSGDFTQLHPAIVARCDAEISKVITGATLNVETGGPGSFALGKVHQTRADDLTRADALWIQDVFQRHVIAPFIDYNPQFRGAALPRLVIRVSPEMTPDAAVVVYGKLQTMGLKIDEEQMYEEFGLRRPDNGGELKPNYAAPTAIAPNPSHDQ